MSIETAWTAIFESESLAPTITSIGFAPVVGQRFQLRVGGRATNDSLVNGEVIDVEYPKRLVFRWQTDSMAEPATALVLLSETDKGPRVAVERIGGDPGSCDIATTLLGRRWQKALLSKALPAYLERTQSE